MANESPRAEESESSGEKSFNNNSHEHPLHSVISNDSGANRRTSSSKGRDIFNITNHEEEYECHCGQHEKKHSKFFDKKNKKEEKNKYKEEIAKLKRALKALEMNENYKEKYYKEVEKCEKLEQQIKDLLEDKIIF